MFQGGIHESTMGLTCTDCHMPTTVAEDGTEYTNHFGAGSPLENPDALELCLSCHSAQGIESADEMVEFVKGKQAELGEKQQLVHAKLDTLYAFLVDATANGGVDEETLAMAREAYSDAYFYYVFERANDSGEDDGKMAAHNFTASMELLDKTDGILTTTLAELGIE